MIDRRALWAKLERDAAGRIVAWHSLVDHSADVAAVVLKLLAQPTIARRLEALGRQALDPVTIARLGALAFLHDIGKANRGFRARIDPRAPPVGHIDELGWLFGANLGAPALLSRLDNVLGLGRTDAWMEDGCELFDTVFAHHGRPWQRERANARAHWQPGPDGDPIADLAPMRVALDRWFALAFEPGEPLPAAPAFAHAFAGLLMLADWLGSDRAFFPFANGTEPDRMTFAQSQADAALAAVGLDVGSVRAAIAGAELGFARLFAEPEPRPLQQATIGPEARLLVLEAETGSGKTEAALWRFAHLFARGEVDGLYFALPTRVAASQIFHRVKTFRDRMFGAGGPAVLRAVPGQIALDDAHGHKLPDFGFDWDDDPNEGERRARWAAQHPKRFLAAQLAVGTIDQVLLGSLSVRHAHLRGTALLRHLLVVDEVHASDTYMEGLLVPLLRAHVAAGGHALLLSATLGAAARARLLGLASAPTLADAEAADYPALVWSEAGAERRAKIARAPDKTVQVTALPILDEPAAVARAALDAAAQGARVLVIRNTVGGAVAVQRALEALVPPDDPTLFRVGGVVTLHHGRFAATDRAVLDAAVEAALDKQRPDGGTVVVGTQTLEQSLDLDADLLLTDLCPMDVLLQRIGRLHRHARIRPPGFEVACVRALVPAARDLTALARCARHGLGAHVYDDLRLIEATLGLIEAHPVWTIPAMNRMLVERATHPDVLDALGDALRARDPVWGGHINGFVGRDIGQAREAGIVKIDRTAPFGEFVAREERLATRLGGGDRQVVLPDHILGPFGREVTSLRISSHMLDDPSAEAEPTAIAHGPEGLTFTLGTATFCYGRFGLERRREAGR